MNRLAPLLFVVLLLLPQCATEPPRGPQGTFSVKVVPFFGKDVRVRIQAYERLNGRRGPALASNRVTGDGITGFVLPLGREYEVSAYADMDGDGRQGPADPAASVSGLRPESDVNVVRPPVILTLPGTGVAADWPGAGPAPAGNVADLLNDESVQQGLQRVREVVPQLPVPPPPLPVPPPPR